MKHLPVFVCCWLVGWALLNQAPAADVEPLVAENPGQADVRIVSGNQVAGVYVADGETAVVGKAATLFAEDVERVTGRKPTVVNDASQLSGTAVLIGTVGSSPVIDSLIADGKLDGGHLKGQWETFVIQTVERPIEGVERAVVIAGSDRRGTAFGVFEISEQIGVSPWYWWADVPPVKREELAIKAGTYRVAPPTVRYRGIFINDEDWGLQPWAAKTFDPEFGDIGPKTYEKVFELLLRLKGNYLWPAMHHCSREFGSVDRNVTLADEWAIVMGASHCEPINRNNVWWSKDGKGEWRYDTNRDNMLAYWEEWARKRGPYEAVWTIGMRGIHDTGMSGPEDMPSQVKLLEQAIADQRDLLRRYVNPNVEQVPQAFMPYKEALAHYQNGLRLPDDVTIIWCEDNFGYLRQLSTPQEQQRSGGSGIYYHISYLGWPRPYLWLNTTPPALIWEEMTKALEYGADRVWVVNVGDIKPGEIGMEFWQKLAWNAKRYGPDAQMTFLKEWAARDFGAEVADEIAAIMNDYYRLGFQRKPELMESDIFNVVSYREAEQRLAEYQALLERANSLNERLPQAQRAAYYQLVLYPVRIAASVNEAFVYADLSRLYARQGRVIANDYADKTDAAVARAKSETEYFNNELAGGKWKRMMYEKGISGNWTLKWPKGTRIEPAAEPQLGVVVEGQGVPISAEGHYAEAGNDIDLMAADGPVGEPWVVKQTEDGRSYIVVPNGYGNVLKAEEAPAITYEFDVPADGHYRLFMLINCPNDKDDSWFIRIDDGKWMTWNDMGTRSDWDWRQQGEYDLKAGRHKLTIAHREDGAMLSRIRFTERPSAIRLEEQYASPVPANQLPTFDRRLAGQRHHIDLFNTATKSYSFTAQPSAEWIKLSQTSGQVKDQVRLWVEIDWSAVPNQPQLDGTIVLSGAGGERTVLVRAVNRQADGEPARFFEVDGYVSIEAEHYTGGTSAGEVAWQRVEDLGRSGHAVTPRPTNAPSRGSVAEVMSEPVTLEYTFDASSTGDVSVVAYCLPTQRTHEGRGVRYAISIDDAEPVIVDFGEDGGASGEHGNRWRQNVSRNITESRSTHTITQPGRHTLRLWMVDPGIVVDKLVIDFGGVQPSELGPPETRVSASQN